MTLVATAQGIGIQPDSVAYYLSAGRIGADPSSMFSLGSDPAVGSLDKWPPGFAAFIASTAWLGDDPLSRIRIVYALLAMVLIVLLAAVLRRAASWRVTVVCLAVVVITSGFITEVFAQFMSEALFLVLTWAAVYLFDRSLTAERRSHVAGSAVAAWVLVSAAAGTRILGLALIPALVIAALLVRDRRRYPLALVLVPAALAAIPALVSLASTEQGDRATTLAFQSTFVKRARHGLYTVDTWFVPSKLLSSTVVQLAGSVVTLGLAVVGLVWLVRWLRRTLPHRAQLAAVDRITLLVLLVEAGYLGMLLWNAALVDPVTPLAARHLLPVFLGLAVAASLQNADRIDRVALSGRSRAVLAVGAVVLLALAAQTAYDVVTASRDGLGYNRVAYTDALDAAVEPMPDGIVVYSDRPDMLEVRTDRTVGALPQLPDDTDEFAAEAQRIGDAVRDGDAAVVYFTVEGQRGYLPAPEVLAEAAGLQVQETDDAVLLVPTS